MSYFSQNDISRAFPENENLIRNGKDFFWGVKTTATICQNVTSREIWFLLILDLKNMHAKFMYRNRRHIQINWLHKRFPFPHIGFSSPANIFSHCLPSRQVINFNFCPLFLNINFHVKKKSKLFSSYFVFFFSSWEKKKQREKKTFIFHKHFLIKSMKVWMKILLFFFFFIFSFRTTWKFLAIKFIIFFFKVKWTVLYYKFFVLC